MPETTLKYGTVVVVVKPLGKYPSSSTPVGTIGVVDRWSGEPVVRFGDTKIARVFNPTEDEKHRLSSVFEFVVPLEQIIHEWIEGVRHDETK